MSGKVFYWKRVRIGDFGLAAITKEPASMGAAAPWQRSSIGSTLYIPPEVLLGLPEDESVDIYATGADLSYM